MATEGCPIHGPDHMQVYDGEQPFCLKCYSDAVGEWHRRGRNILDGTKPIFPKPQRPK